jgi:tRNA A37 methylthiotransferase MiaB
MNEYDSSRMLDVLRVSHGMEATDRPEEADVLLLNTCSIREKAQEKVFSHARHMARTERAAARCADRRGWLRGQPGS